jgi:MerR family transcriptional regulator, light-induced transcriptional regulator
VNDSPTPELPKVPDHLPPDGDIAAPEFLASLLADGDDDMAAWVMSQALADRSRAEVYDKVVRPAMELVGTRWEEGQWSISVEHLASVALNQALSRVGPPENQESRIGPTAVLAAPEMEQHVAGLACLAQVLEDDGWHVENLGANVPEDDLVSFISARDVDLVALSIGTADRLEALRRAVDALRAAGGRPAELPVIVGGNGVAAIENVAGASHVCHSLADAQKFARSLGLHSGVTDRR